MVLSFSSPCPSQSLHLFYVCAFTHSLSFCCLPMWCPSPYSNDPDVPYLWQQPGVWDVQAAGLPSVQPWLHQGRTHFTESSTTCALSWLCMHVLAALSSLLASCVTVCSNFLSKQCSKIKRHLEVKWAVWCPTWRIYWKWQQIFRITDVWLRN